MHIHVYVHVCVYSRGFRPYIDDHVVHAHVYIELLYPLQDGYTPLHWAAEEGHTTCVEHLLSTPGIDVNIKDRVRYSLSSPLLIIAINS